MKLKFVLFGLIVVLLTACASPAKELHKRGFDTGVNYPLLSLKYNDEIKSQWSVSGAYLFFIGGLGGSGSTEVVGKIGFVLKIRDRLAMIKLDAKKVEYKIDNKSTQPRVSFLYCATGQDGAYEGVSLTQLIEDYCERAVLTLSLKDFNNDIQVLKYAG